jgi:hypothetical protein
MLLLVSAVVATFAALCPSYNYKYSTICSRLPLTAPAPKPHPTAHRVPCEGFESTRGRGSSCLCVLVGSVTIPVLWCAPRAGAV